MKKSYAILRHQKAIMEHLQVCSLCSEYVLGHIQGGLPTIKFERKLISD